MRCHYACGSMDHLMARRQFLGAISSGAVAAGGVMLGGLPRIGRSYKTRHLGNTVTCR